MSPTTLALVFLVATNLTAYYVLHRERRRSVSLAAQLGQTTARLHTEVQERHRDMVQAVSLAADLESELAKAKRRFKIREPAHPVIEYLLDHGPTTMGTLVATFGDTVGQILGKHLHLLEHTPDHILWWLTGIHSEPQTANLSAPAPYEAVSARDLGSGQRPGGSTVLREANDE